MSAGEAASEGTVVAADPFDLPEWLGTERVTWTAHSGVRDAPLVTGTLRSADAWLDCDLLAADRAYPRPVLPEPWRRTAHQTWTYGQVLLVEYDGRLTLTAPGTAFSADLVLEVLARLARAVGVSPERFAVTLRL